MAQSKITIEYTRQKLGEKGKNMTDQQILDLLATLCFLCDKAIDSAIEINHKNKTINYYD